MDVERSNCSCSSATRVHMQHFKDNNAHQKSLFSLPTPTHMYKPATTSHMKHTSNPPSSNPAIYRRRSPMRSKKSRRAPCTKRKRRSNAAKCVVRKGGNKNTTPNKTQQSQPNHE
jgi:hypothetical protein